MPVQINYSNKYNKNLSNNSILFVDDKFSPKSIQSFVDKEEFSYICDLLKINDLKKNIAIFEINSKKKIILISIKKDLNTSQIENLGAELYNKINFGKNCEYFLNSDSIKSNHKNFLGYFLHGLKLKSYKFNKYKTKKEKRLISINVFGKKNIPNTQNQLDFKALEQGTFYARDLVSEPGNILHPDEYAKRLSLLRKDGLKVTIYDEKLKTW